MLPAVMNGYGWMVLFALAVGCGGRSSNRPSGGEEPGGGSESFPDNSTSAAGERGADSGVSAAGAKDEDVETVAPVEASTGGEASGNAMGTGCTGCAAVAIAAGDSHTCVVLDDSSARCWGWNIAGQLGNDTTTTSRVPVPVFALADAVAVTGGGVHSCALLRDATIQCWGDDFRGWDYAANDGQVPNPASECEGNSSYPCGVVPVTTPVAVSGVADAIAIAGGYWHDCALLSAGTVKCWGIFADGTRASSSDAITVADITDAVAITAGAELACAVSSAGDVQCWGRNSFGELGGGTDVDQSSEPITVPDVTSATMVSAGANFICALVSSGEVVCWGNNRWGQLGDGASVDQSFPPTFVVGITDATMIASGQIHACAVLRDGTVKCWGYGYYGGLGNGTNPYSSLPVTVTGIANTRAVALGEQHSCALLTDGAVFCWGNNDKGQLGDGTADTSFVPVRVAGF